MFYAQFILAKKGPLSKIWLAAHWEKKLTKAQIFETNVSEAVEEVMKPKVNMALRTVGHLLLGIVRIYSKKTRYLLSDTNEVFIKMKLNLRNGFQLICNEVITEGDDYNEFDDDVNITIPESIEFDNGIFEENISRFEDITLKDNRDFNKLDTYPTGNEPNSLGIDDFGEFGDLYGSFPASSIHTPVRGSIEEIRRSNDSNLLMDQERVNQTVINESHEKGNLYDFPIGDGIEPDMFSIASVNNIAEGDLFSSMIDIQHAPEIQDVNMDCQENNFPTTVNPINGEEGSFELEPLNRSDIEDMRHKRPKRVRKLIVDDNTNIPNDVIKRQMEDFSDILANVYVAPPNKKMLKMCVTGDLNHLMSEPGINIGNKKLLDMYKSRLIPSAYKPDLTLDHDSSSTSEIHSQPWADLELNDIDENVSIELGLNRLDSREGDFMDFEMDNDFGAPAFPDRTLDDNRQNEFSGIMNDDIVAFNLNDENNENDENAYRDPFSLYTNSSKGKLESYGFGSVNRSTINEDGKWNRRAMSILKKISPNLENEETVTFSSIVSSSKTRKQAAEQFYALLSLAKSRAISVEQKEPFSEIHIRLGEGYDKNIDNQIIKSTENLIRTPLRHL